MRAFRLVGVLGLLAGPALARSESFPACVAGLRAGALTAGVPGALFDEAFAGVRPNPDILARIARQSEFSTPIWTYLAGATGPKRIANGRAAAARHEAALEAAETRTGVDRRTLMGVWGLESDFGASAGGTYVIESLATLACADHRDGLFRDELIAALRILASGAVSTPRALRGSWAGAMGQTQFLPSSYLKYATDGDGDGRRDIWGSGDDALASIATFLAESGWVSGLPWGFEARLPAGFDLAAFGGERPFREWRAAGVSRADGEAWPAEGGAALFFPAGAGGPALLITKNFFVIKVYNTSDSYALGVGHLGDRILGGPPLRTPWPAGVALLGAAERTELQTLLRARGHVIGKVDGKFGPETREAVRAFQLSAGLVPDGFASPVVLKRLRER